MSAGISPWLTATEAAVYTKRGKRFLRRAVAAGKLRAAKVGGRQELLFRADWLDQWLEDLATPVLLNARRRACRHVFQGDAHRAGCAAAAPDATAGPGEGGAARARRSLR